ncbi:MAG: hypothetical protein QM765_22435 [Myxococcales bacterium]
MKRLAPLLTAALVAAPGCQLLVDVNDIVLADAATAPTSDSGLPPGDAGPKVRDAGPRDPDGGEALADAGSCESGECLIGGKTWCAGATEPGNACRVCAPAQRQDAWSDVAHGAGCSDDGNACTNDVCDGEGQCDHEKLSGTPCGQEMACREGTCEACGCAGRQCGQDACGADCGTCDSPLSCTAGACTGSCEAGRSQCGARCCEELGQQCAAGACVPRCELYESQGCGAGEACYPTGAGAACATPGAGAEGASCAVPQDCGAGLTCFGEGSEPRLCHRLCDPSASTCGAQAACVPSAAGHGVCRCPPGEIPELGQCQCSVAAGDSCRLADSLRACNTATGHCEVANDRCGSAGPTLSSGVELAGDLGVASDDLAGSCGGGSGATELVFAFTLAQAAVVDLRVSPALIDAGFKPTVYVRRNNCLEQGAEVGCFAATGGTLAAVLNLSGGTYYIVVDGGDGASHPFGLTVTARPRPANDACDAAVDLSPPRLANGDTSGAFDDVDGTCSHPAGRDVAYGFTAAPYSNVRVTVTPDPTTPLFRPAVYLKSYSCSTTGEVACKAATGAIAVEVDAASLGGGSYLVVVDGATEETGKFEIKSEWYNIPLGDRCVAPADLTKGTANAKTGNTLYAGADYLSAASCSPGGGTFKGRDLVYKYAAPNAGTFTITVTPTGTWDPALWVTSGPPGAANACGDGATTCIGTRDEKGPGVAETLTIPGASAADYYIVVDAFSATERGEFTIEIN